MLVEAPLTCGRCAYREEIRVFKDTVHRCGREDLPRHVDPMAQTPPAWCKIRPKAEPDAPDLAPVIAHLRAEAERKRARGGAPAPRWHREACEREASALERAAEILSRHV